MIMRSNVLLVLLVSVAGVGFWTLREPGHGCPGTHPALTNVTITYTPAGINVSPPTANAQKGGVLRFNLFGAFGTNVAVKGKAGTAPDPSWIDASGNNLKFFVCVPDTAEADDEYQYGVMADGSPPLDPVVRIL